MSSVQTCQVCKHVKCANMSSVKTCQVCKHVKCANMSSVKTSQVSRYFNLTNMSIVQTCLVCEHVLFTHMSSVQTCIFHLSTVPLLKHISCVQTCLVCKHFLYGNMSLVCEHVLFTNMSGVQTCKCANTGSVLFPFKYRYSTFAQACILCSNLSSVQTSLVPVCKHVLCVSMSCSQTCQVCKHVLCVNMSCEETCHVSMSPMCNLENFIMQTNVKSILTVFFASSLFLKVHLHLFACKNICLCPPLNAYSVPVCIILYL
jgi:hypothetical protein